VHTCLPKSLCTWDYRVLNGASGHAELTFDFFTEQGSVVIGGADYEVRKHGRLSGHWSFERNGITHADARKPNAFVRRFEISAAHCAITLEAASPFTRRFVMIADGAEVGSIRPAHAFTRRAFIDCDSSVPELIQLFAFWLAVLTWRRSARNRSSNGNASD
jgi:hypothetical protein